MTETIDSAKAAASTLFLGHNGEFWDFWLIMSVVVAAAAAIAIGVTTSGSIVSHKREAAAAETELEKFKLDTARQIAEAQARASTAELKLAEFRRERSIGDDVSNNIVAALKPFAGTKFDIGHAPSGREQWDFLWSLEMVFPKAGWIFVNWEGPQKFAKLNWTMEPHLYGVANVLNVSIELSPEHRDDLLPAATVLAKALNDAGIAAKVEDHIISGVSTTTDAIHILVGEKR